MFTYKNKYTLGADDLDNTIEEKIIEHTALLKTTQEQILLWWLYFIAKILVSLLRRN